MTKSDEASRWLTLERIGRSELIKWALFDHRREWPETLNEAGEWLIKTIRLFACGSCFDLANAVALETGAPIAVISRRGDLDGRIAHAVVYGAEDQSGADILGRRPISDIVAEFKDAVGPVSLSMIAGDETEFGSSAAREEFAVMAAALPWLPRAEGREPTPFPRFREMVTARTAPTLLERTTKTDR